MSEPERELVTLTRGQAARELQAGQEAGRAGKPATACPHSPAGDANEQLRAAAWLRGHRVGRRPAD